MNKNRTYLASLVIAMVGIAGFVGCTQSQLDQYLKTQPTTQPVVVSTQPATSQPTTQPAVVPVVATPGQPTVNPGQQVLHAADVAAQIVNQNTGLISLIVSLLGVSAVSHGTNIAEKAASLWTKYRSGQATVADAVQAGTAVAEEVKALDPKAASTIQKVEQVGAAVAAAVNAPK